MKVSENIYEIMDLVMRVMDDYKKDYPDVVMDREYIPFKITEEWGECLQVYLMLTNRGRQKGKSKSAIRKDLSDEFADVLGYLLAFAHQEGIDPVRALENKWARYIKGGS